MLGLTPEATAAEIRAAYRRLALDLHPDRASGASAAAQLATASRMAEVNAAAEVLGDPERRREYDRGRARDAGTSTASSRAARGAAPSADTTFEPGHAATASLAGLLPWAALIALLLGIFIFTAFAGGPGGDEAGDVGPGTSDVTSAVRDVRGSCIQVAGGFNLVVNCGVTPNEGRIVAQGSIGVECPEGTEAFPITQEDLLACVDPATGAP